MKRTCPICKTLTDSDTHQEYPFCSERCRQRELGNWASEKYVVSDPVFDLDELEAGNGPKKTKIEEDEDFKGFPKPNGTVH
jgi:endogenous inhibitor of DNA gyrase (YacG/DUF329 family)